MDGEAACSLLIQLVNSKTTRAGHWRFPPKQLNGRLKHACKLHPLCCTSVPIIYDLEKKKEQVNHLNKAESNFTIIHVSTVTGDWTRRVGLTNMGGKECWWYSRIRWMPGCGWLRRRIWCWRPCRRGSPAQPTPPGCSPTAGSAGGAPSTAAACTGTAAAHRKPSLPNLILQTYSVSSGK